MQVHTSATHPLRVDWLPTDLPGRIGMTLCPGKRSASRYTGGRWERDLGADLDALRTTWDCDVLVSLIRDEELDQYEVPDLYPQARGRELEVWRFPIRDVSVPDSDAGLLALVARILRTAEGGRTVVIHCIGGLGRTGLVAGCVLVALGHPPGEALDVLHRIRSPHCPETRAQEDIIRRFPTLLGTLRPSSGPEHARRQG